MNMIKVSEVFQGPGEITDQWTKAFCYHTPFYPEHLRLSGWLMWLLLARPRGFQVQVAKLREFHC